ncbi:MAG: LamG domain-containing protein [Candidatus Poribacteria bacterium]
MKVRYLLIGVVVLFVAGAFANSTYAKIDPKTCIGMWLFDDNKGDVATDSSGSKNDGKLTNSPKWVDGKIGKALEFDGANTHVVVTNTDNLNIKDAITLEAWVFPKGFTANGNGILTKDGQYILGLNWPQGGNANKITQWLNFAVGGWIIFSGDAVVQDSWNHIAATYNGSVRKAYLNGKLVNSADQKGALSVTANNVLIAQGNTGVGTQAFKGIIDELAIFNVALSDTDIADSMRGFLFAVEPSGKLTTTWASVKSR